MAEENNHHADVKRELERIKTREHNIYSLLEQTKRDDCCISPVISSSMGSKSVVTGISDDSSKFLPKLQLVYFGNNNIFGERTTSFECHSFDDSKLSEGEVDIDPGAYSDGEEMILTPRQR